MKTTSDRFDFGSLKAALKETWEEASSTEQRFLLAHYGLPGHAGDAGDIAEAAGFNDYHSSNTHYGGFARRAAEKLGFAPEQWLATLATGAGRNAAGHWILKMDSQVVRAVEEMGIASESAPKSDMGAIDGFNRFGVVDAAGPLDH